ncbi:hypothetical protein Bbelb_252930 [Branchiostoma belcheri]|nr:hypothetical protein Bbelb_252930 [Branchiostoma belcheri]
MKPLGAVTRSPCQNRLLAPAPAAGPLELVSRLLLPSGPLSLRCILLSLRRILLSLRCILLSLRRILLSLRCILLSLRRILLSLRCILLSLRCILLSLWCDVVLRVWWLNVFHSSPARVGVVVHPSLAQRFQKRSNITSHTTPHNPANEKTNIHILPTASDWNLRVDLDRRLVFPEEIASTNLKPDVVLWSTQTKQIVLVELTVPWEERIEEAYERKALKYQNLLQNCVEKGLESARGARNSGETTTRYGLEDGRDSRSGITLGVEKQTEQVETNNPLTGSTWPVLSPHRTEEVLLEGRNLRG